MRVVLGERRRIAGAKALVRGKATYTKRFCATACVVREWISWVLAYVHMAHCRV